MSIVGPSHPRLAELGLALGSLTRELPRIERWGRHLADVFRRGGRLLATGNGGSAAEAEHLTGELVGRYCHERRPLAAIAIGAEFATVTAIANDYPSQELFARPVRAHGRPGDVLVALSTSGRSPNVVAAVQTAHKEGLYTIGFTGRSPNPLADVCDDALVVHAETTATIQEVHLVAIHLLCEAIDCALGVQG
jgi:D-sedoheptulose 7-phosphate isomerase